MRRRLARGEAFALLLCDMDGLKDINDAHGHSAGDEALRKLAITLRTVAGPEDEIVRIGGDEFCVLTGVSTADEAAWLAARRERQLALAGCAATFGWASHPFDTELEGPLFKIADERLYARKYAATPDDAPSPSGVRRLPVGHVSTGVPARLATVPVSSSSSARPRVGAAEASTR